jgi:cytoskeletal protein RodZ
MKTDAPSVPNTAFPCTMCGARLDAAHLEPAYPGAVCTFCGAHLPERPGLVVVPDVEGRQPGRSKNGVDVGDTLRTAREGRSQSLKEAARATRIKEEYLHELEGGATSFDPYPGRIYGRFFLREYADYLGLDPKPLLRTFDADGEPAFLPQLPKSLSQRPPRRRRWAFAAAILLVVMLVGTSIATRHPSRPAAIGRSSSSAPSGPPRQQTESKTPTRPAISGVHAVLTLHARCWVQVFADGKRVLDRTFTAGHTIRAHAKHDLKLRLGNAGSVTLVVNHRPIATGAPGQVMDLHFAWRDGRLIRP